MRLSKYFQKPNLLRKLVWFVLVVVLACTAVLLGLFYLITLGSFKFEDAMNDVFQLMYPLIEYAEK